MLLLATGCNQHPTKRDDKATASSNSLDLAERCDRAAIQLRSQLGSEHSVIVRPPLIIAGDQSKNELTSLYSSSIQPATVALKRRFFNTAISRPTTVLLFSDQTTYQKHTARHYAAGDHANSIYGYYEPTDQTAVVNLSAGEGTIVHELIHAMIMADYPEAPIWLNEGLASLFEHSRLVETQGKPDLIPLHNWRLRVLQRGIADGQQIPLRDLAVTTNKHGQNDALFYSHARYFCFYLYELGQLEELYAGYRNKNESPRELLAHIAPDLDWADWDRNFRKWASNQRLTKTHGDDSGAIHRLLKD